MKTRKHLNITCKIICCSIILFNISPAKAQNYPNFYCPGGFEFIKSENCYYCKGNTNWCDPSTSGCVQPYFKASQNCNPPNAKKTR